MCVGNLFGGTPKPPAPPPEMPTPDRIKDEEGEEDKLSTRKKKALEIQKVQQGVKQFGAINPASLPETPAGGITTPSP